MGETELPTSSDRNQPRPTGTHPEELFQAELRAWDPAQQWPEPPAGLWRRIQLAAAAPDQAQRPNPRARRWVWLAVSTAIVAVLLLTWPRASETGRRGGPTPSSMHFAEIRASEPRVRLSLRGAGGTRLLLSVATVPAAAGPDHAEPTRSGLTNTDPVDTVQ